MRIFILTLNVFLLITIFTASLQALDKNGMVLYLSFDEGKGDTAGDSSGNDNDGILEGNIEWVDGQQGKAVRISDDDAGNLVRVADDDTLDITDDMTIGMWVNIETIPDGSCSIITKADTYMIHTSNWSGNGIEQELLLWPFDAWQTAASTPIPLNEWHHVTGVYDGESIIMYIDGDLGGKRDRGGKTTVTQNDLIIGRDSRGCCNTRRSLVTIDEVAMYNRPLAEDEVEELMQSSIIAVKPAESIATKWSDVKAYY
ncbi:hypothetical protein GF312_06615 [Candidatus Poribacteria bacterium]|nr:hypothetical protein [Candidatus Poribacteria bacterium]